MTSHATALDPGLDPGLFRTAIRRFATGVTVITTSADGVPLGTTASALSSLSAEPPLLHGVLAHLECREAEVATGGTHTLFFAHVASAAAHDGEPLDYWSGRFGRFEAVA